MTVCHAPPGHSAPAASGPRTEGREPVDDGAPTLTPPVIAVVGRANVGKSTLLSRASGRYIETANAPGTTIVPERVEVTVDDDRVRLVDLPGTRSLVDRPAGGPFWKTLLGARPDAILVVVDAGDLARHLPLVLGCRDLGLPVVVAANLADEAERDGLTIDAGRLSQLLASPVHLTVGRTGEGVAACLSDAAARARQRRRVLVGAASPRATTPVSPYPPELDTELARASSELRSRHSLGAAAFDDTGLAPLVEAGAVSARGAATIQLAPLLDPVRWEVAAGWARQVVQRRDVAEPIATRLTRLATAPWPGVPLFGAVTLGLFATLVIVGGWLSALLTDAWTAVLSPVMTAVVTAVVPVPELARAILWALDGGLLAMVAVGIPYVLVFYVLLAVLEDSGYLTSAAVLLDRVFNVLGLPGRAAIPLLSAAGCNVPAIYGTRVLATRRERVLGAFVITLTPCSARSAVIIAALAPFAGLGAALAAFGVVALLAIGAGVTANALVPGRQPALVLELTPLRVPVVSHVATKAVRRFRSFVVVATPIMVIGSLVVGIVYETGLWSAVTGVLEPVTMGLLGLPAVAGLAIGLAFLRKELALQLLVAFAIVEYGVLGSSLDAFLSPAQLFVFAIVSAVSVPCAATLAALVAELGRRSAVAISAATLVLALGAGALIARVLGIA